MEFDYTRLSVPGDLSPRIVNRGNYVIVGSIMFFFL